MPRKSAAALSVITPIVDHRPPVPEDMPEAQAIIWRGITNRLPHDWFRREHLELLRAYCQHAAIAQTLARQIEQFKLEWLPEMLGAFRPADEAAGSGAQADALAGACDADHAFVAVRPEGDGGEGAGVGRVVWLHQR